MQADYVQWTAMGGEFDRSMQQTAAFKAVIANIHIFKKAKWVKAHYRVAMMAFGINRVSPICMVWPKRVG